MSSYDSIYRSYTYILTFLQVPDVKFKLKAAARRQPARPIRLEPSPEDTDGHCDSQVRWPDPGPPAG